jgi:SAM-dependent methyltransferase
MYWTAKAAVQKTLSLTPWAESLNYLLQRKVSKSVPAGDDMFRLHFTEAVRHLDRYDRHAERPVGEVRAYEFGAGWDLTGPIAMWALGVERQTVVDLYEHLRFDLVAHTISQLRRLRPELEEIAGRPVRVPDDAPVTDRDGLAARFGIDYRAPFDARATGLPEASFDLVSSTFTLEHIPSPDIDAILVECARLLAPGGVVSCSVDMADHYAFDDPRISVYNYLRYDDRVWRLVNSSLHYQNRLRARDYLAKFRRAGLAVVETRPDRSKQADLAAVPLARRFAQQYTVEELADTAIAVAAVRAA